MERRKEARFNIEFPALLTVLGIGNPFACAVTVRDISNRGMRLHSPASVSPGNPIRLDARELLMLGEVCRCVPEGDGFCLGLQIAHSLSSASGLEALHRALQGESHSSAPHS